MHLLPSRCEPLHGGDLWAVVSQAGWSSGCKALSTPPALALLTPLGRVNQWNCPIQNYQTELSKIDTSQWIASRILQYDLANCGWYEKEWSIPYWHFQKSQQYSINSRLRKNLSFWGAGDHWGVGCIWAGKPGLTSYICGKHRFAYQVPPSSTCPNIFLFPDRSIPGSRLSGRPMDLPDEGEWGSAIKSICYHNINKRGTPDICHLHFWVNQQKWQISGIKRGL